VSWIPSKQKLGRNRILVYTKGDVRMKLMRLVLGLGRDFLLLDDSHPIGGHCHDAYNICRHYPLDVVSEIKTENLPPEKLEEPKKDKSHPV
jgi:hypothetical protein